MKNKLIGIFICMLLIGTVILPVSGRILLVNNEKKIEDSYFKTSASDDTKLKWMIAGDGLRCLRSYWIHIPPSYDGSESVPLVFVLHGATGPVKHPISFLLWWFSSCSPEGYTAMSEKADEEGFIVVYPLGKLVFTSIFNLPPTLDFTYNVPNYPPDWIFGSNRVDDVGFMRALIVKLQQDYNIDQNKIFITGLSAGAHMSYYLASSLSDLVAVVSPVAGAYIAFKNPDDEEYIYPPDPKNPVSIIVFHGTFDSYETDEYSLGVNESVQFWVEHNKCDPEPEIEVSGNIIKQTYANGTGGSEVVLYTVVFGGHEWFGGPESFWPPCEISATDLMWEFFEQHPKQ